MVTGIILVKQIFYFSAVNSFSPSIAIWQHKSGNEFVAINTIGFWLICFILDYTVGLGLNKMCVCKNFGFTSFVNTPSNWKKIVSF